MRKQHGSFFAACVVFLCFGANGSYGATAFPRVVITFASFSERETVLFVAQDQGFFRRQGLDVQLVYVGSGSVALSSLSRGDSHLNTGSASGAILGAIAGGGDVAFVAGLVNKLTGLFVASPQIKSPPDLKGKKIAVTSIGGGNWVFTMLALEHWGLDAKRDGISVRALGNESVRAQALTSGTIDATQLGYAFASALRSQGFRILADLAELGIPYQGTALLARRSIIESSPEIIERSLRALAEAISFIQDPKNKGAVVRSLAKGLHLSRLEEAADGYERVKGLYEKRLNPNIEGIRNTIRLLGGTNDKIGRLRAEDVIDDRIVRKLEKERVL
ncbi:MAG: ABC transporter substrate-binding protein [Deltaproteobacteria bacterium]|nr:ABC transporter substrate-binding protein [Deltaproteobacteria bacterium]